MQRSVKSALFGAALAVGLASQANATVLTITLNNVATIGEFQDAANVVNAYDIGAFSEVVGFSYDVTIATIGSSWLSEASIYYTNSAISAGVITRPGFANTNSGTASYTGAADLTALALNFLVGADGLLRVEFAEGFDDFAGADAVLNGTISFTYNAVAGVPEPASWALMIGGFGLVGGALRHSRRATPALV